VSMQRDGGSSRTTDGLAGRWEVKQGDKCQCREMGALVGRQVASQIDGRSSRAIGVNAER